MPPSPFYNIDLNPKPIVMPEPRPIEPYKLPSTRPAARPSPKELDGAFQVFGNPMRNSRLPSALSRAPVWERVVTTPIGEDFIPGALVASDQCIVLSTPLGLLAFDQSGQQIGGLIRAQSDPVITPTQSHILHVDRNAFIAGHPLSADASRFQLDPSFGSVYSREFISLLGDHLIVIGQKMLPVLEQPEAEPVKPEAAIDAWVWTDSVATNEDGYAINIEKIGSLGIEASSVVAAAAGDSIALALRDNIYILDGNLDLQACFTGSFEPVAMSTDEAGYIYLIVSGPPANRLLIIDPEGRQIASIGLPFPPSQGFLPPIVGYDHAVYVPAEGNILVIDAQGNPRQPIAITDQFTGAAVTFNGRLLVADGSQLIAHAIVGEPVVIAEFKGETIRTAPVLLRSGTIWVATDKNLYALKPAQ